MRGEQRDDQTYEKTDVLLNHHTTGRFNKPSRPLFFLKRLSPDCRYPLCIIPNLCIHYEQAHSTFSPSLPRNNLQNFRLFCKSTNACRFGKEAFKYRIFKAESKGSKNNNQTAILDNFF